MIRAAVNVAEDESIYVITFAVIIVATIVITLVRSILFFYVSLK